VSNTVTTNKQKDEVAPTNGQKGPTVVFPSPLSGRFMANDAVINVLMAMPKDMMIRARCS
jgi:hypothetical protein